MFIKLRGVHSTEGRKRKEYLEYDLLLNSDHIISIEAHNDIDLELKDWITISMINGDKHQIPKCYLDINELENDLKECK